MIIWLGNFIKFIFNIFRKEILIFGVSKIKKKWRNYFMNRNILVFGPKASGKTSLLLLMKEDRPFEIVNGDRKSPSPTVITAILDEKFKLQKNIWMNLKMDVPGDLDLRKTWEIAIQQVRPQGIIYMIDGSKSEQLENFTNDIWENVLVHYTDSYLSIKVIHIFINFMDKWATSNAKKRKLEFQLIERFEKLRDKHPEMMDFDFQVSSIQLSPNEDEWNAAKKALLLFGASLMSW